jgi:hypothetical protein
MNDEKFVKSKRMKFSINEIVWVKSNPVNPAIIKEYDEIAKIYNFLYIGSEGITKVEESFHEKYISKFEDYNTSKLEETYGEEFKVVYNIAKDLYDMWKKNTSQYLEKEIYLQGKKEKENLKKSETIKVKRKRLKNVIKSTKKKKYFKIICVDKPFKSKLNEPKQGEDLMSNLKTISNQVELFSKEYFKLHENLNFFLNNVGNLFQYFARNKIEINSEENRQTFINFIKLVEKLSVLKSDNLSIFNLCNSLLNIFEIDIEKTDPQNLSETKSIHFHNSLIFEKLTSLTFKKIDENEKESTPVMIFQSKDEFLPLLKLLNEINEDNIDLRVDEDFIQKFAEGDYFRKNIYNLHDKLKLAKSVFIRETSTKKIEEILFEYLVSI